MSRFQSTTFSLLLVVLLAGALGVAPAQAAEPIGGPGLSGEGVLYDPTSDAVPAPPSFDGGPAAWVIADLESGEVLAAKNPHEKHLPASTIKTLTALVALENLELSMEYEATQKDQEQECSCAGVAAGSHYSLEQLLYGMMLVSGNDAASAIAGAGGGWKKFLKKMNAKAEELQANNTHVVTPSGLDGEGQSSSAYDLALIVRAAMQDSTFREITHTIRYQFPDEEPADADTKRGSYEIVNKNPVLISGETTNVLGGKTGFTNAARRTFWVAQEKDGRELLVTMMKYDSGTFDTAVGLLNWGFENADNLTPIGELVGPIEPEPEPTPATPAENPDASETPAEPADDAATFDPDAAAFTEQTPVLVWIIAPFIFLGAVLVVTSTTAAVRRKQERARAVAARHFRDEDFTA